LKGVLMEGVVKCIYIEISINYQAITELIEEYQFSLLKVDGENHIYVRQA